MITVIIPAYNEEKNIPRIGKELIPVLRKLHEKHEIIIIDDGSIDSTVEEAKKLIKKNKSIRLVKHGKNKGLGAAVRTGIAYTKGDVTIILDSDFTFHPREIPKLLDAYNKSDCDCVIGSHFTKGGKTKDIPVFRIIMSKGISLLYSIALGKRISSISSIFRVYKTRHLKELNLTSDGFMIMAEIVFKLLKNNRKIIEVPVTLSTRIYGTSKIDTKNEIKNNIMFLLKIMRWKIGFS